MGHIWIQSKSNGHICIQSKPNGAYLNSIKIQWGIYGIDQNPVEYIWTTCGALNLFRCGVREERAVAFLTSDTGPVSPLTRAAISILPAYTIFDFHFSLSGVVLFFVNRFSVRAMPGNGSFINTLFLDGGTDEQTTCFFLFFFFCGLSVKKISSFTTITSTTTTDSVLGHYHFYYRHFHYCYYCYCCYCCCCCYYYYYYYYKHFLYYCC